MNFDDIKDRLKDSFQSLAARVQESTAWNQATERFYSLSPRAQKGVLAGLAAFFAFAALMLPYSYFSSSQDLVAEYEEKKQLIRELFRVQRASSILDSAPPIANVGALRDSAQAQINLAQLQADQIKGIIDITDAPKTDPEIPKSVIQNGVQVSLAKLNLRQLIDLGYQLERQTLHPSARMVGLEVTANHDDPHYFDVIYKIVSFSLPEPQVPQPKNNARGAKRPPKPAPADDEE